MARIVRVLAARAEGGDEGAVQDEVEGGGDGGRDGVESGRGAHAVVRVDVPIAGQGVDGASAHGHVTHAAQRVPVGWGCELVGRCVGAKVEARLRRLAMHDRVVVVRERDAAAIADHVALDVVDYVRKGGDESQSHQDSHMRVEAQVESHGDGAAVVARLRRSGRALLAPPKGETAQLCYRPVKGRHHAEGGLRHRVGIVGGGGGGAVLAALGADGLDTHARAAHQ